MVGGSARPSDCTSVVLFPAVPVVHAVVGRSVSEGTVPDNIGDGDSDLEEDP